jgi:hypothetical protein
MKMDCFRLRRFAFVPMLICIALLMPALVYAQESSCVTCHTDLEDETLTPPVEDWLAGVHSGAGIGCHTCHGGDPTIEDEDAMGTDDYKGAPSAKEIPELCGSCHSDPDRMRRYNLRIDEYDLFRRSGHGRALYERGDTKVATCVSCHGSHKILAKDDTGSKVHYSNIPETCGKCHGDAEYMKGYDLPTDQVEKYNNSYHAKILHGEIPDKNPALAPTCASCHSHSPLLPGAVDVPEICGRCHGVTANYFKSSPHYVALNGDGAPKCIDCHGNHEIKYPTSEMFGTDEEGHCGSCHDEDSVGYEAAQQIKSLLQTAEGQLEEMEAELAELEHSGRNLGDIQGLTEIARTSLTEVLPITHTLSIERIKEKTDDVAESAEKHLEITSAFKAELVQRRVILGAVLAVIVLNIIFFWIKRHSLD